VTDISTPRIKAYIQKRIDEGMENGTINRELAALKRIMNLGAEQTPPKVDKIPHIPMLQENNVRRGFFEHGDFLALREALPDYLKGFVTFAYKTGWRVSEIENLTWSQVDLDNGVVRLDVGSTKNNEGRTVYIDQELISVLATLREKRKEQKKILPWVFTNKAVTDRIKEFRKSWEKGCEDAEIGKRLFHDFRRTAVRNMVRAGVPERVVMMVSGHKTRNIFERYNIVSDTDLKLAAQKQETYLQAQMGTVSGTVTQIEKKKGQTSEI
jgi:integrase